MSQYSYPSSDSVVGTWSIAPLYSKLDDLDETDYISSGSSPCTLSLSTITAPNLTRGKVFLQIGARAQNTILTVTFKSGTDTILTWTLTPPNNFVGFSRGLTNEELALVSNWATLTVVLSCPGTCDVAWLRLADEGITIEMGEPIDNSEPSYYCSVTGYLRPAHDMAEVDGQKVWKGVGREPRIK